MSEKKFSLGFTTLRQRHHDKMQQERAARYEIAYKRQPITEDERTLAAGAAEVLARYSDLPLHEER